MARRPARRIKAAPAVEVHIEQPGPTEFSDPIIRRELARASVWFGLALAIVGVIVLAQPLMLIIGGMIFAVFLDGGTRLLGRVLPIRRGLRLALVIILGFGFVGWTFWFAGTTIAAQFEALRAVVEEQFTKLMAFAASLGLIPANNSLSNIGQQLLGSVGRLTSAVGTALGAFASLLVMIVIGIFGVGVYIIGLGTSEGAPIPIEVDGKVSNLKFKGEDVITRFDDASLRTVIDGLAGRCGYLAAGSPTSIWWTCTSE
jgi:hypothetical protein